MSTPLLVLLICVATYRLTRLVVADGISDGFRDSVEARFGPESSWAYLVNCPWCVSVWVSIPTAWVSLEHADRVFVQMGLIALTASAVAGYLHTLEPE